MFGDEVGEQEPALAPRKACLVDDHIIDLECDPTREENLQLTPPNVSLASILPGSCGPHLASPHGVVDRLIHCDCGFEARGADEEGLVAEVRRHALEAHGMALSQDEALVLAFRAELADETPTTTPHDATARTNEEER